VKHKLTCGIILVLVILAVWLWVSQRPHTPTGGRASPQADVEESQPSPLPLLKTDKEVADILARYPPPPGGYAIVTGTPPQYLTFEQQVNPVHGRMRSSTLEEMEAKVRGGAKAKLNILVMDSTRTPVSGADIEIVGRGQIFRANSDGDGFCLFERTTAAQSLTFRAQKDAYYSTEYYYYLDRQDAPWNCVKDGKWQPWDVTLELVLKEKRDPAPLHVKALEIIFPQKGVPYGIDLVAGDLVEPDGKGTNVDVIITCNSEKRAPNDFNRNIRIETVNGGGFIHGAHDKWSEMKTPYTAPATGYESQVFFQTIHVPDKIVEDSNLRANEHLIFETYSRGDQPCVGKIYGLLNFGEPSRNSTNAYARFLYFFNPVPGDRRIESDPDKRLFRDSTLTIELQP